MTRTPIWLIIASGVTIGVVLILLHVSSPWLAGAVGGIAAGVIRSIRAHRHGVVNNSPLARLWRRLKGPPSE